MLTRQKAHDEFRLVLALFAMSTKHRLGVRLDRAVDTDARASRLRINPLHGGEAANASTK